MYQIRTVVALLAIFVLLMGHGWAQTTVSTYAGQGKIIDRPARQPLCGVALPQPQPKRGEKYAAQWSLHHIVAPGNTSMIVMKPTTNINGPVKLAPQSGVRSFHLRTREAVLIQDVLHAYGMRAAIGPDIHDRIVSFDTSQLKFSDAVKALQLATNSFMVPLAPRRMLAVGDSPKNRAKYERQIMETVTFPGLNKKEMVGMETIAHSVVGIGKVVMNSGHRDIMLRAPQSDLHAVNEVFRELMTSRGEVLLDIHVYEVDRTREVNTGVILPNSASLFNLRAEADNILADNETLVQEIISSGEATAGDWQKIIAILIAAGALSGTDFNSPFAVFGGGLTETGAEWNTTAANMLLNSSDVQSLNQVQLNVLDQAKATFLDGERYPVISGKLAGLNTSGATTATIPQFRYVNLGLTLNVTPYIEDNKEVMLRLDLKLASLTGNTLNGMPVLSSRQYEGVVSIHSGDSALLVSAMSRQDAQELTGIPGEGGTTNREDTISDQELVIMVTPHVIRRSSDGIAGSVIPLNTP